jgi:hypothetical protein
LVPTTGIHHFLDPRLVCANCNYLWTPDEAAAGRWHRGDTVPEAPGALGFLLVITVHWGVGFLLLLFLVLNWLGAERNGWCSSSWDYDSIQKCVSGEATQEALRIFRVVVPSLLIVWLLNGYALTRNREAGCLTTPISGIMLIASFWLILYMN